MKRRRGGAERAMVPDLELTSYYGQPILKRPAWKALDIAGYLFLGGLAGGSSVLAAAAERRGDRTIARRLELGALGAISLSAVALVHDLGRPSRFANMLRVMKPTSPMSVGSWLLSAYAPAAAAAAASSVTGRVPRIGRAATVSAGVLGAGVASYTAVLLADTAVPAWHGAYRELPFVFVSSAASAAAGLALVAAPSSEAAPARRLACAAATTEIAAMRVMESRLGSAAEVYRIGRAAKLVRLAELLTGAGGLVAATLAGRSTVARRAAGCLLLGGSLLTRFGIFHAGVESTEDPKYVVAPQRARIAERERLARTPEGQDG